jgi:glycosyltransferase involved in cell wall biosynthesis
MGKSLSKQGYPRVSVVVATYNAASFLQRCIASLREQTFHDWELIVIDGSSTDGTVDVIRRNSEAIAYWQSRPDRGIYDAWNQALLHANGEYVCFLGADDTWHTADTLQQLFDAIGKRDFDLVTGCGYLIRAGAVAPYKFGGAWDYRKITRRMTICHPGALHRRNLFERYGPFDASFVIGADYDFLLRLPADARVLHTGIPLVDVADGGISRDRRWTMLRERFRAQARCPRVGHARAAFHYVDKLWRIPVARMLGIPN